MVQKVSRWREQAKFAKEKMAEKAGLGPNVKNHSSRKTMIQTLTNNDIQRQILFNCRDIKIFKV